MKQKHKWTSLCAAALMLSASLAVSACGVSGDGTSTPSNPGQAAVQSAYTLPDAESPDAAASAGAEAEFTSTESAGTESAGTESTEAKTTGTNSTGTDSAAMFEDLFSNRDLSGTWDASAAVRISLNGASVSCDAESVTVSGSVAAITAAGTYLLSGTLENGTIVVDAGKEDKVQLVLDNVSIHSQDYAAIYVKQADKVFLTLADGTVNTLSNGGSFQQTDDNEVDSVVFSKDDLTLNGGGKLVAASPAKHGIVSKDDLVITGGVYEITAASHALSGKDSVSIANGTFALKTGKDAVHSSNNEDAERGNIYIADGVLSITAGDDGLSASGTTQIDGGTLTITASEGIEGQFVRINSGAITITASDDGINAARKSDAGTPGIEINGGEITVTMGAGDTDGIDSNGTLTITGGTIHVTGRSCFDVDGAVRFTGGVVTINGQQVTTIPVQQMGGRGGMGAMGGMGNTGGMGRGRMPADNSDADAANGNSDTNKGSKTNDANTDSRTSATSKGIGTSGTNGTRRNRGVNGNGTNGNGTNGNGTSGDNDGTGALTGRGGRQRRDRQGIHTNPDAPDASTKSDADQTLVTV